MAEQMGGNPGSASPIIVDSDWKSQAMAEKERLAEAEQKTTGKPTARAPGADALPPADFATLVGMLATQAVMSLGGMADRKTGAMLFDPEMARLYIDLLEVIEQKTRGNLTPAEEQDLKMTLNELRLRFVELSRAVAAQATKGGQVQPGVGSTVAGPGGPTSPGSGGPDKPPMIRVG